MPAWQHAETLVLRYWKGGGPVGAMPARVVSPAEPVIWVALGTRVKWSGGGRAHDPRGLARGALQQATWPLPTLPADWDRTD
ncbi:MAG TPA: hypothetical protein VKC52_13175 [Acidimicrobiia bacterium]|nr:hypothetical protein [Acidimicrobiia bacterium]